MFIFQIICSVDPKLLKLTSNDDAIYKKFQKDFPGFKLDMIDEDQLKSAGAKVVDVIYVLYMQYYIHF